MRNAIFAFIFFIGSVPFGTIANAQMGDSFGLGLHAGVSHSGWNLSLVGQFQTHNLNFYLGPSISLNRGLPGSGPIGLNLGADYILPSQKSWLSTVINADYLLHFYPSGGHTDVIHEAHLSYGLRLQSGSGFYVIQQFGVGMFVESAYLESLSRRDAVSGYNGLVRLRAGYFF